jgi:G3E family GTPase
LVDSPLSHAAAVIVNDIGALNIDDALLKSHSVLKKSESVIAMQNGW